MTNDKKLLVWLDDERAMPEGYNIHVKTAAEAIKLLRSGTVKHISFDHHLGNSKGTGYDVAKWIEEQAYHGRFMSITWHIHTDNPVAYLNIHAAMANADKYWEKQCS